ncbi:UNVERIFIED_CONTAM: hypothetical protein Sradi_7212100 [Sesamum radiatum]|uniref:DUF4283 domain-containing protein n=1 Tax=Sesamum radiatum TaxID=300843 RepID=A0AAW2IPD8_SESRA
MADRVRREFNFSDFYSLANRVLDGDEGSLDKLLDLKKRWELRFPEMAVPRRTIPRFPSKITFLPRRSIQLPTVDVEQRNSPHLDDTAARPRGHTEEDSRVQETQESQETQRPEKGSPPLPEVFVGNVKLTMETKDNIAEAFLNSSRKTLRYIPPMTQHDEIIIKPTPAMVMQGSARWQSTAVGYFLGRRPYFPQLEAFVRANWKGLQQVSATANGFYFFRFKTLAYMEEVIEEGPWLFQGQPVVLQAWEQGMSLRRQKHVQIPVWIRLRHLPMEYWTEEGLSAVASGIGVPLYTDRITQNCLRLDYARVCVMLSYHSKLPKHLVVLSPVLPEGAEIPIKVDIEYEWLPMKCRQCVRWKRQVQSGDSVGQNEEVADKCVHVGVDVELSQQTSSSGPDGGNVAASPATPLANNLNSTASGPLNARHSKGKEIIVYNSFQLLGMEEADLGEKPNQREEQHNTGPISSPTDVPP